jgi:hypothetical protein
LTLVSLIATAIMSSAIGRRQVQFATIRGDHGRHQRWSSASSSDYV